MTDPFPPMYVEVPLPVDQTKPHELQQVNVSGITARSASIQTFTNYLVGCNHYQSVCFCFELSTLHKEKSISSLASFYNSLQIK